MYTRCSERKKNKVAVIESRYRYIWQNNVVIGYKACFNIVNFGIYEVKNRKRRKDLCSRHLWSESWKARYLNYSVRI